MTDKEITEIVDKIEQLLYEGAKKQEDFLDLVLQLEEDGHDDVIVKIMDKSFTNVNSKGRHADIQKRIKQKSMKITALLQQLGMADYDES